MKSLKFFSLLLVVSLIFSACGDRSDQQETAKLTTAEITIEGMTCTGCARLIEKEVKTLAGVDSVAASFKNKNAVVVFEQGAADTAQMRQAIEKKGYTVKKLRLKM